MDPSIHKEQEIMEFDNEESWMDGIWVYIKREIFLKDKDYAQWVKFQSSKYLIYNEKFYKKGYLTLVLRYLMNF